MSTTTAPGSTSSAVRRSKVERKGNILVKWITSPTTRSSGTCT